MLSFHADVTCMLTRCRRFCVFYVIKWIISVVPKWKGGSVIHCRLKVLSKHNMILSLTFLSLQLFYCISFMQTLWIAVISGIGYDFILLFYYNDKHFVIQQSPCCICYIIIHTGMHSWQTFEPYQSPLSICITHEIVCCCPLSSSVCCHLHP